LLAYPDVNIRHLQFVYHSILSINDILKKVNRRVHICYGEAIEVFQYLNDLFDVKQIFSHEESGTQITWNRDKQVKKFCHSNIHVPVVTIKTDRYTHPSPSIHRAEAGEV